MNTIINTPKSIHAGYEELCELSFSGISSTGAYSTGAVTAVAFELDPPVPYEFYEALRDFHSGQIMDLDAALDDTPPN